MRIRGAFARCGCASPVAVGPTKNPTPPRHLAALGDSLSAPGVFAHALPGGLVLVAVVVVLCVIPTRAEFRFPCALGFLGGLDAFLDGSRGLAAVVAGRSAALRIGRQCGCEECEGEEEVTGVREHSKKISSPLQGLLSTLYNSLQTCSLEEFNVNELDAIVSFAS